MGRFWSSINILQLYVWSSLISWRRRLKAIIWSPFQLLHHLQTKNSSWSRWGSTRFVILGRTKLGQCMAGGLCILMNVCFAWYLSTCFAWSCFFFMKLACYVFLMSQWYVWMHDFLWLGLRLWTQAKPTWWHVCSMIMHVHYCDARNWLLDDRLRWIVHELVFWLVGFIELM